MTGVSRRKLLPDGALDRLGTLVAEELPGFLKEDRRSLRQNREMFQGLLGMPSRTRHRKLPGPLP